MIIADLKNKKLYGCCKAKEFSSEWNDFMEVIANGSWGV